jgi:hypothetical protein
MKGKIVNPLLNNSVTAVEGSETVRLLLREGDVKLLGQDPETAMADLQMRATQMSQVLEAILREPHGEPHWGLNE